MSVIVLLCETSCHGNLVYKPVCVDDNYLVVYWIFAIICTENDKQIKMREIQWMNKYMTIIVELIQMSNSPKQNSSLLGQTYTYHDNWPLANQNS